LPVQGKILLHRVAGHNGIENRLVVPKESLAAFGRVVKEFGSCLPNRG